MIKIKSIFDKPLREDGFRVFIGSTWPKGVQRKGALCDWMKSLGPSHDLRGWMSRNPRKLEAFRDLYLVELGRNDESAERVCAKHKERGDVTLLYAPSDEAWRIPEVLAQYLRAHCGID